MEGIIISNKDWNTGTIGNIIGDIIIEPIIEEVKKIRRHSKRGRKPIEELRKIYLTKAERGRKSTIDYYWKNWEKCKAKLKENSRRIQTELKSRGLYAKWDKENKKIVIVEKGVGELTEKETKKIRKELRF